MPPRFHRTSRSVCAVAAAAALATLGAIPSVRAQPRRNTPANAVPVSPAQVVRTPPVEPPSAGMLRRLQRATVSVLDGHVPIARGVVVAPSGRVITTLAAAERSHALRVQYPDGRIDRARIIARDNVWGVCLLEGSAGRWSEGIELATRDARSREGVGWIPAPGAHPTSGTLRRRRSFVGVGATLLRDAWELDPVPANTALGSGVIHLPSGTLVGLVLPGDEGSITGATMPFAVPLSVLQSIVALATPQPWIGLVLEESAPGHEVVAPAGGLRVVTVYPDGPGARAGLRAGERGDIIVAAEGAPVPTLVALGEALQGRRVGDTVRLQIVRAGAIFEVPMRLGVRPAEGTSTRQ